MIAVFKHPPIFLIMLALALITSSCNQNPEVDITEETETSTEEPEDTFDNQEYQSYGQTEDTATEEVATDTTTDEPQTSTTYYDNSGNQWRIVVSSMPSQERAEKFASRSNIDAEVIYVQQHNTYRVVYGTYENLKAAQDAYAGIRGQFPDAWLVRF